MPQPTSFSASYCFSSRCLRGATGATAESQRFALFRMAKNQHAGRGNNSFPAATQFLGPIQNYVELPRHGACIASNHEKPLTIGSAIGPELEAIWGLIEEALRGAERTVRLNCDRHQGIGGTVKEFTGIVRPNGRRAARRRDDDLGLAIWIGFDVHISPPRLI